MLNVEPLQAEEKHHEGLRDFVFWNLPQERMDFIEYNCF